MKAKIHKFLSLLFPFIIVLSCINDPNCHKDAEEQWLFKGRQMIGFFGVRASHQGNLLYATDTIANTDTMYLMIKSKGVDGDSYRNDTLIVLRDSNSVDLSIYADAYEWQGCGVIPPTDEWPTGLHGTPYLKLPPSFNPGVFFLRLHQPDNSIMLDTIIIRQ